MFVKIYEYHVQKDKVDEYLTIQQKASEIYSQYLDLHTMFLNSKDEDTKWLEITTYNDEVQYNKSMNIINERKDIQDLFEAFQSLLLTDRNEIKEEDFIASSNV